MKKAIITGVTGQDGSYLTEFLLDKGYEVHGIKRRSSSFNTDRIDHIISGIYPNSKNFFLHYGDLSDQSSLIKLIEAVDPDEIYNLGAQSHVAVSFEIPEYTADIDALGTLRLLEAIRILNLQHKIKFYQASSSELYGLVQESPQSEETPFYPRSPYAVAKLYAFWITKNYREAYSFFACNGILFNHESPRRGETFVTRKITRALSRIKLGTQNCLYLGNIEAKRDWGHAKDYVEMQWMMLQQSEPDDYVISTGIQYSVKEFIEKAANCLDMEIEWKGADENTIGYWVNCYENEGKKKNYLPIIKVDKSYYRPAEVDSLLGNSKKAYEKLSWKPRMSIDELVKDMIKNDLLIAKKEKLIIDSNIK